MRSSSSHGTVWRSACPPPSLVGPSSSAAGAAHAAAHASLLGTAALLWWSVARGRARLAGLVMWMPAGGMITAFAPALMAGWLRDAERRAPALRVSSRA